MVLNFRKPLVIAQFRQKPVVDAQGKKAQNNADCNNHAPIVGVRSPNHNDGITLTARESQGLEQSICKWPDTRKRPDYHYDHCSDQGVPENVLGFFNVSNDKGYNQRDTDCLRQNFGDLHEVLHEGNSGRSTDIPKPEAEGEDNPNDPYPKGQDRENQNNADYIAHIPIVRAHLPSLNELITLIARAIRGRLRKQGFRVSQGDTHILIPLAARVCQPIISNYVSNPDQGEGGLILQRHRLDTPRPIFFLYVQLSIWELGRLPVISPFITG